MPRDPSPVAEATQCSAQEKVPVRSPQETVHTRVHRPTRLISLVSCSKYRVLNVNKTNSSKTKAIFSYTPLLTREHSITTWRICPYPYPLFCLILLSTTLLERISLQISERVGSDLTE